VSLDVHPATAREERFRLRGAVDARRGYGSVALEAADNDVLVALTQGDPLQLASVG
jgi:hypothetical protein